MLQHTHKHTWNLIRILYFWQFPTKYLPLPCVLHIKFQQQKMIKKNFFERIPKLQMILQKPFLFFSLTFREPMYFVFEW